MGDERWKRGDGRWKMEDGSSGGEAVGGRQWAVGNGRLEVAVAVVVVGSTEGRWKMEKGALAVGSGQLEVAVGGRG